MNLRKLFQKKSGKQGVTGVWLQALMACVIGHFPKWNIVKYGVRDKLGVIAEGHACTYMSRKLIK
ncbi:MAG: hypothetical protein WAW36_10305 [Methylovulum miyakonense]|uniref:hypothetical protein n=1 Tax=Methylovulum miyakonense TaxID=645578 RepID=UPI003BB64CEE